MLPLSRRHASAQFISIQLGSAARVDLDANAHFFPFRIHHNV